MRILVYGAGAIGSIFSGKITLAGYDVTILARNKRYKELSDKGLVLRHSITDKTEHIQISVIDKLDKNDIYDYIIVAVQYTHIDSILPILTKNKSKNIVFVVNNPLGYEKYIQAVGYKRIILGFPSAGGERKDGVVNYFIGTGASKVFQSTTFGELSGKRTDRLKELMKVFKNAKFSPAICENMNSWQKTHLAIVLPISRALYKFDSDNYKLAKSYKTLRKMVLATRECFSVLKNMGIKVTPVKLNFYYFPTIIIVPIFMILMNTKIAEYAMAKHTIVAKEEMTVLENIFEGFIKESGRNKPAYEWLA
ncbi:MAG: ketopantoate reductase family protein [bacterium]|nr:ketopantoate reductase family protein [bacterium]